MGNNVKNFRVKAGLTQSELSKLCKVDRSAVAHWESDSNPKLSQLLNLAQIFGCTVDELLAEAEEPTA